MERGRAEVDVPVLGVPSFFPNVRKERVYLCGIACTQTVCTAVDEAEMNTHHCAARRVAGLGTGLLSTIAVSLSQRPSHLSIIGPEVLRIAFRLGVLVDEVSANLHVRSSTESGPKESWAYVIPNVLVEDVQMELDAIHASEVSSPSSVPILPSTNGKDRVSQKAAKCSLALLVSRQ